MGVVVVMLDWLLWVQINFTELILQVAHSLLETTVGIFCDFPEVYMVRLRR